MGKSFIGKITLNKVLTIFKTELSKKQDLMTEFTDQEIQDMWDNPKGTDDSILNIPDPESPDL